MRLRRAGRRRKSRQTAQGLFSACVAPIRVLMSGPLGLFLDILLLQPELLRSM